MNNPIRSQKIILGLGADEVSNLIGFDFGQFDRIESNPIWKFEKIKTHNP